MRAPGLTQLGLDKLEPLKSDGPLSNFAIKWCKVRPCMWVGPLDAQAARNMLMADEVGLGPCSLTPR